MTLSTPSPDAPSPPGRPALVPLSVHLKRLHAVNRERLGELEERLKTALREQEEWVLEKNDLLDQVARRDRDIARLNVHIDERRMKETALEQRIQEYQCELVSVEAEYSAMLSEVDQRCCELQVEVGEWKEATETERHRVTDLEQQLKDSGEQQRLLARSVEQHKAEVDSLNEEVVDLQRRLFQFTMDSEDAEGGEGGEGGAVARKGPTLNWTMASPSHAATQRSVSPLSYFIPSFTAGSPSSPPIASSSMYEELVDLHEAVSSLEQQLTTAQHSAAAEAQRADEAAQRLEPLEAQVEQLSAEVDELRLLCGDDQSRRKLKECVEREVREDLRRWQLRQEEELSRRLSERERRQEEERRSEEEQSALQRRQLTASVKECGLLVEELLSMWASLVPTAGVQQRGAESARASRVQGDVLPVVAAVQCVTHLRQLRSAVFDEQARRAVSDTTCRVQ